jgi:transposase
VPKAVPLLTPKQVIGRVEWATAYTLFDWSRVVFTDETYIECGGPRTKAWHKNGHRPIRPKVKFPIKLMFWSAISVEKKGVLISVSGKLANLQFLTPGTMTSARYIQMLDEHFLPTARKMFGKDLIFAQDNAPCHKSKVAIKYFRENQIELLPWPAGSPDLNPIENLWGILKANVAKRFPKTKSQLEQFAAEEWAKIPQEVVKNTILSLPARIAQVIDRNGAKCDY